jgi:hypothetical protein
MKLTLSGQLKQFIRVLQGALFPTLQEELGPLTEKHRQLVAVLSRIRIEGLIAGWAGGVGRPAKDRRAMARAFGAKAVYHMSPTRQLLERLSADVALRRICACGVLFHRPRQRRVTRSGRTGNCVCQRNESTPGAAQPARKAFAVRQDYDSCPKAKHYPTGRGGGSLLASKVG